MQLLDLALLSLGDVRVEYHLIQVITQSVRLLLKTSQKRASPNELGDIILNIHLEVPLPLHQWTEFLLQHFNTILNSLFCNHI
jgi:hypothetical protein